MQDPIGRFLSAEDRNRIEACIRAAEQRTQAEIVVLVVPASHHYPAAGQRGAAACALPVALGLTPVLGGVLWAGHHNVWIFLSLMVLGYGLFQQALTRLPAVTRLFVSSREMDAEVREAACNQFFRKGLYRTRDETGVLIYISVFERRAWVIGDRGINARIPEGFWTEIIARIVQGIKAGRPADAICQSVEAVSRLLQEKFPSTPANPDELKNLIVETS